MNRVAVWESRFVTGWGGDERQLEALRSNPVMGLIDALEHTYSTDAHFTPGVIHDAEGEPVSAQVRLKKGSIDTIRSEGMEVLFDVIVIDVDHPSKAATEEWVRDQWALLRPSLRDTSGIYMTRGGYRLLWTLDAKVPLETYLAILADLRHTLATDGVDADELVDWTRCYRLPCVLRDGVLQEYFMDLSSMDILPEIEKCPSASKDVLDSILGARSRIGFESKFKESVGVGRNVAMFKGVASRLRNVGWMPEDMYLPVLELFNERFCEPPLERFELEAMIGSVMEYDSSAEEFFADEEKEELIIKLGELPQQTRVCLDMLAANPGTVYSRFGQLVRHQHDEETGSHTFREVQYVGMMSILEELLKFIKVRVNKEGDREIQTIGCPPMLSKSVLEAGDFGDIQVVTGVVDTPLLQADGSIIQGSGYHPGLKKILDCSVYIEPLPRTITYEDALVSRDALLDLFVDFPFRSPAHESTALATLLAPLLRNLIDGPVPLSVITSSTPGSGKSLIADICSALAIGDQAPRMAWSEREEENEKRLTAIFMQDNKCVLIDNIDKTFGGPSLDACLTAKTWTGRVLGKSQMVTLPINTTFAATGNNIHLSGDLARRVIACYLDPKMEKPEERRGYKHNNIKKYVLDNRAILMRHVFILARAYQLRKGPSPEITPFGGYEGWSHTIREMLLWLGLPDPITTQEEFRRSTQLEAISGFIQAAHAVWGETAFTSRDLFDVTVLGNFRRGNAPKEALDALKDNLECLVDLRNTSPRKLTWLLSKWDSRVFGGKCIEKVARDRRNGNAYKVKDVGGTNVIASIL